MRLNSSVCLVQIAQKMLSFALNVAVFIYLFIMVRGQMETTSLQPHVPQQRRFGNANQVQDHDHIKQHLDGQINTDNSAPQMSHEQMQFHYFKLHDTDRNNMLDGIELIKAITHTHEENAAAPLMNDQEMEQMIDQIMRDDDYNDDGFIDYSEFLRSQAAR